MTARVADALGRDELVFEQGRGDEFIRSVLRSTDEKIDIPLFKVRCNPRFVWQHEGNLHVRGLRFDHRDQIGRKDRGGIVGRGDPKHTLAVLRVEDMGGVEEIAQSLEKLRQLWLKRGRVRRRNHSTPRRGGNEQGIVEELTKARQPG